MASSISFKFDERKLKRLEKLFKKAPRVVGAALHKGFGRWGLVFLDVFTRDRLSGRGSRTLGRVTGRLANSAQHKRLGKPTNFKSLGVQFKIGGGTVGGRNVDYARVHEEGATIRPKKGEFLTIPFFPTPLSTTPNTFRKVRSVRIRPRLNLKKDWKKFGKKGQKILAKAVKGSLKKAAKRG